MQKLDLKLKVALGFLTMLTFYALPLFSLILGSIYVVHLNRKRVEI